jgi:hypothetical protein
MRMVCGPWHESEQYARPTKLMAILLPTSRCKALTCQNSSFKPWRIMPLEHSTWPLLYGCDTEASLIWMPESSQKSLNSIVVNWVPLSVIILLGTPNQYMISLMNYTALAAVFEAPGFTSIHFVNLCTATKMCVNPPLVFLNGPTRSSPMLKKPRWLVWSVVGETIHVSDERKTDTLHSDILGSQRQIRQWANKTHAYMFGTPFV